MIREIFEHFKNVALEISREYKFKFLISLRKPKVFALQILQRYLMKQGRVRTFFPLFIWIKESCVRKFEGLERSKLLGISQTIIFDQHKVLKHNAHIYLCQKIVSPGIPIKGDRING